MTLLYNWIPAFAGMTREKLDYCLRGNDKKEKYWIPAFAGMTNE
jgi:hypothetical protein